MRERASSLVRTISMKRVLSRRNLVSGSSHVRFKIHSIDVSRIPLRNSTVFIHWSVPLLGLHGDTKRVVIQNNKSASWFAESIIVDTIVEDKTDLTIEFTLHEDVVVRNGRQTTWKSLGTGSFNVNLMKRTETNQLLIIPLGNGKKNTCSMELRVDGEAPNITDLFVKKVCCDDAFLIHAFHECPLTWNEHDVAEGVLRIKERWPRIAERLTETLQASTTTRTVKSHVYWCYVLRSLEASGETIRDAVRPLKQIAVDGIMHGIMPSEIYDSLIEMRWVEKDIFDWASNVARETTSRILDPLVDGKDTDSGYKSLYGAHLERFSEWLSVRFIVCDVKLLLVRAIDICLE